MEEICIEWIRNGIEPIRFAGKGYGEEKRNRTLKRKRSDKRCKGNVWLGDGMRCLEQIRKSGAVSRHAMENRRYAKMCMKWSEKEKHSKGSQGKDAPWNRAVWN